MKNCKREENFTFGTGNAFGVGFGTGGKTTSQSWDGLKTSPQASPMTKLQISSGPSKTLLRTYTTSP